MGGSARGGSARGPGPAITPPPPPRHNKTHMQTCRLCGHQHGGQGGTIARQGTTRHGGNYRGQRGTGLGGHEVGWDRMSWRGGNKAWTWDKDVGTPRHTEGTFKANGDRGIPRHRVGTGGRTVRHMVAQRGCFGGQTAQGCCKWDRGGPGHPGSLHQGSTEPGVTPTEPLKCPAPAAPTHAGTCDNKVNPKEVSGG